MKRVFLMVVLSYWFSFKTFCGPFSGMNDSKITRCFLLAKKILCDEKLSGAEAAEFNALPLATQKFLLDQMLEAENPSQQYEADKNLHINSSTYTVVKVGKEMFMSLIAAVEKTTKRLRLYMQIV